MKKFLLLWPVICLVVVFLPKVIDRFTPKTVIKEVYRVKEVIREVEKPVFKGERIVEKERIVYKEMKLDIFEVIKLDENTFTIKINDTQNPNNIWNVSTGSGRKGLILHRTIDRDDNNTVTASTVG